MRHGLPVAAPLLVVTLLGAPAEAQGPPHEIPELRWISAARALDDEIPDTLHPNVRKLIDEQSEKFRATFGSAARHGLREGRLAPEEFCTVKNIGKGVVLLGPDTRGEFGSGLLLAEVAVVATVTDIIPGFGGSAWIESLLKLGDVVPLHGRSPTPSYVLVPSQRVVAEDRVFCGGIGSKFDPVIGMRVVVVGRWVQGVVPAGLTESTLFATVQKDGESLRWSQGSTGPPSLVDLHARVDEAVSGNLFSLTSHLVRLEEHAEERQKFGVEWSRRTRRGCRLVAVGEDSGEETEICIDPEATAAAKARFEKSWQQQCADGGAPPLAEVVSGGERIKTDVCERDRGALPRHGTALVSRAGTHFVSDDVRRVAIGKWTDEENGCSASQRQSGRSNKASTRTFSSTKTGVGSTNYTIDLAERSSVSVKLTGMSRDFDCKVRRLGVTSPSGEPIPGAPGSFSQCTNQWGTLDDLWKKTLDAGLHHIVVYPYPGGTGDYTITIATTTVKSSPRCRKRQR